MSRAKTRLFRGYGPIFAWIAAFLAMALLAPTVAPEKIVSRDQPGSTEPTVDEPLEGGSPTTQAAGVRRRTIAGAVSCPGPQIQGDPYSPQCRQWSSADNGGATSQGVTGDTITITLRDTGPPYDIGSAIAQLTGERITATVTKWDDIVRTYRTLIEYMNKRFQFYGRQLKLKTYEGQGSVVDEVLGGGQAGANADAIAAAQQHRAFADVSYEAPVFAEALAKQKVISTNAIYPPKDFFAENAPYVWAVLPDCTNLIRNLTGFLLKEVVGQPVLAGEFAGKPRRIGAVVPDSPTYKKCGDLSAKLLKEAGHPFADVRYYRLSLDGIPNDAKDIASAFANEGITTVVLGSDPLFPYFMTTTAQQSDWHPEWIVSGVAFQDADFAGQLFEPHQWRNAFGVSMTGAPVATRSSYGYTAYRSVDSATSPVELIADYIYGQLYLLAIGVHGAGPNLTPETFAQGMRAYRPARAAGPFGAWGFPDGEFSAPRDARIIWWDPNETSTYNGSAGTYRDNGTRYPLGEFPAGPPAVSLTR